MKANEKFTKILKESKDTIFMGMYALRGLLFIILVDGFIETGKANLFTLVLYLSLVVARIALLGMMTRNESLEKKHYHALCLEKIKELEEVLKTLPMSVTVKQMVIEDFKFDLKYFCDSSTDYKILLSDIEKAISFFEKEKAKFNSKKRMPHKSSTGIANNLAVLGLPANVDNFDLIKRRYRELVKKTSPRCQCSRQGSRGKD